VRALVFTLFTQLPRPGGDDGRARAFARPLHHLALGTTIYPHNGTYSIIIKDNHYDTGNYCEPDPKIPVSKKVCVDAPKCPYYITQLDPYMNVEWQFQNTSTEL